MMIVLNVVCATHNYVPRRVVALVIALAVVCQAQLPAQGLIYVDADDGFFSGTPNIRAADPNLTLADVYDINQSLDDDNKWGFRNFGANGSVITSANGAVLGVFENAPEIVQTVSGLTPGVSYDMYAVYWSGEAFSWGIRAGLSSNPGNNQYFNRNGNFAGGPPAIAGTRASSLLWSVLPPDNPDPNTNDDQGVFREGPRDMFVGLVGAATADSNGQVDVFIDDLSPAEFGVGAFYRSWFDGIAYVEAGTVLAPVLTIDRQTGNISLDNDTANDLSIAGYSITSAVGALASVEWMRVDDVDTWDIVSDTANQLAEQEAPGGSGGVLLASGGPSFDFGNIWLQTPIEDISISVTLADQSVISPIIQYTGDPIPVGDFTGDGLVTLADYQVLLDNLQSDYSALPPVEAYLLGDIDSNQVVDLRDFLAFRVAYENFPGNASLSAALAGATSAVPEPNSIVVATLGLIVGLLSLSRRRQFVGCCQCNDRECSFHR
jgi:hypothetical protein